MYEYNRNQSSLDNWLGWLEYRNILNKGNHLMIDGLPFMYSNDWKTIGVLSSGGADSTMMFYQLAKHLHDNKLPVRIKPIQIVRRWNKTYYLRIAKDQVVKFMRDNFGDTVLDPFVSFLPEAYETTPIENLHFHEGSAEEENYKKYAGKSYSDVYFFHQLTRYVADEFQLPMIYSGTTMNPVDVNLPDQPQFRKIENVDYEQTRWINTFNNAYNSNDLTSVDPYRFIEKNYTTAMYFKHGLEELYKLTQSCEELKDGCGQCFHCKERQWAYDNKGTYYV